MGCLPSKSADFLPAGKDSLRSHHNEASKNLPYSNGVFPSIKVIRSTTATSRDSLSSISDNRFPIESIVTSHTPEDDFLSRTVFSSAKRSNSSNSPDVLNASGNLSSTPHVNDKILVASIGTAHSRQHRSEDGLKTNGLDDTGSSPAVVSRKCSFDDFIMDPDEWNAPFLSYSAPIANVYNRVTVKTSVDKIEVVAKNWKQSLTPLKVTTNTDGQVGRSLSLHPLSPKKFPQRNIASVGKNLSGGFHETYAVGSIDDAYLSPKNKNVKSIIAQIESPRKSNSPRSLDLHFSTSPQKNRYKTSSSNTERYLSRSCSLGQVLHRETIDARIQRQRRPSLAAYTPGTNNISNLKLTAEYSPVSSNDSACKGHQINFVHDPLPKMDLQSDFSAVPAS